MPLPISLIEARADFLAKARDPQAADDLYDLEELAANLRAQVAHLVEQLGRIQPGFVLKEGRPLATADTCDWLVMFAEVVVQPMTPEAAAVFLAVLRETP